MGYVPVSASIVRQVALAFVLGAALLATACAPGGGTLTANGVSAPLPDALSKLALDDTNLTVHVEVFDAGTGDPRGDGDLVDLVVDSATDTFSGTLPFTLVPGDYTFTLTYLYDDPVFGVTELATAAGITGTVGAGDPNDFPVDAADLAYADDDGDQTTNIDELEKHTDPRDAISRPGPERVSTASDGTESNGNSNSFGRTVSADGRYVAFYSNATNLVAGDTNAQYDVFVKDRETGETTRASVDSAGTEANNGSFSASISADGRYVAFYSSATNLVAGDINGFADVFVHDRVTGETTRASVDSAGGESNGNAFNPSISADGRYVAFYSDATNLVAGDTNSQFDVFVKDRETGATTRVSVDSLGGQANNGSFNQAISADGRFVAFYSNATNLVPGDTNANADIFVHDRQTGVTVRASVNNVGGEADAGSFTPTISADGRFVAFYSLATNLVAADTNATYDIFVHDLLTGATTRASVDSQGQEGDNSSFEARISGDGRYVVFYSNATNLVTDDTNAQSDVFVKDRETGDLSRVSVSAGGDQADSGSFVPYISADGRNVAFYSNATNLVAGDTNTQTDVFATSNPLSEINLDDDDDGDGLDNRTELIVTFTRTFVADTDGDGVNDGDEVNAGTDPLDPSDF